MSIDSKNLVWDGLELRLGTQRGRIVATVISDAKWPGMWRVQIDGKLTDVVNITRAKDAAIALALADLKQRRAA